jgi:hypothetical protein
MITGSIYKITSQSTNKIYIGSTRKDIKHRFKQHQLSYDIAVGKKQLYISSFEILKYGDAKIELIKNVDCKPDELVQIEKQEILKNHDIVVNKNLTAKSKHQSKKYVKKLNNILLKEYQDFEAKNRNLDSVRTIDDYVIAKRIVNLFSNKIDNVDEKLKLLNKLETHYNIEHLNLEFENELKFVELDNQEFNIYKKIFRSTKDKPTNYNELKRFYVGIIKNICGPFKIIKSKRVMTNGKREYDYVLNTDLIKNIFGLFNINLHE